jgi:hypothetical protein
MKAAALAAAEDAIEARQNEIEEEATLVAEHWLEARPRRKPRDSSLSWTPTTLGRRTASCQLTRSSLTTTRRRRRRMTTTPQTATASLDALAVSERSRE